MPAKTFLADKKADKQFLKLPHHVQRRVLEKYRLIRKNPLSGAKLKGELKEMYKHRIGDYRIIYRFDSKKSTVIVLKIEHRQGVYR